MRQSKLIDLLRSFDARETARFRELAASPFFNKNQKIRALLDFCLGFGPDYNAEGLDKRTAYRHIYKEKGYEELRLNNLLSDTLQLGYQLLGQLELESLNPLQKRLELQSLLDRRAEKHLRHSTQRLQQLTERMSNRSHNFQHERYEMAQLLDRYALQRNPRRFTPHLQHQSDALDRYYWCNKLRLACDMASRNRAINATYTCHFLEELLSLFRQQPPLLAESPALQTYYQALMMLSSEEEAHYRSLRQLLSQHHSVFTLEELQDLYDYAQNYCVKRINSGEAAFYRDILDLYKEMLDRRVLLRQGYLTQWSYINIVTAGIRLKEFKWTEDFIYTYRSQLAPEVQENVFTYSLAALQFERAQYLEALQTLQGVEFSDAFYHMAAKMIQLKSYYELQEEEALYALLEASRKYIKRNRQLSTYQKQSNGNFLKMIARLQKLRSRQAQYGSAPPDNLNDLLQRIDTQPELANRSWLRRKVSLLA